MKKKTVIIADIIKSRKTKNRYEIQKKMLVVINYLNNVFKSEIEKKVEISAGDSFQGLFDNLESAFLYARIAQMLLHPTKIRVGIGIGELDYMDNDFGTNLLDGEAYHNAKNAIEKISKSNEEMITIEARCQDETLMNSLNLILRMYYQLRNLYSENTLTVMLLNELLNPMSMNGEIHYLPNANEQELELISKSVYTAFKPKDGRTLEIVLKEIGVFSMIDERFEGKKDSSSSYILRGVQEEVSKLIGTSRQNVNKYYSKGVSEERLYTYSIINLMKEVIK